MTDQHQATREAVRADGSGRWPATAVFFLNGLTLSTYIVRLPALKGELHLADGQLGVTGALFALAALLCMQFVGPMAARVGSRNVLRAALVVMPLLLAVVGLVHGPIGFALAATALGAAHGTTDAAMNAYAVNVEQRSGRPVLNGCHAAWSISAVVASVAAAALAHAGVPSTVHLVSVGVLLLAGGLGLGVFLRPDLTDRESSARPRRGLRGGWTRPVIALGLTGMALMVCEGAALSWSGIFLHDSRGASLGLAAIAITAYTAGQTGGRLIGDRLTARYGPWPVFRTGGLIGACGLTVALLAPRAALGVAGFAIMGLGTSVLIPLTYSAVGRIRIAKPYAAALVARFTTFTYAGILLGPAAIGGVAELVGLGMTLAVLVPLLFAIAIFSRRVLDRDGSTVEAA